MLSTGVHRPPPVSGDCYWQIEKWNNPLDGNDIIQLYIYCTILLMQAHALSMVMSVP